MADLNLSLEIVGSTSKSVDELGRTKAAVDQVGQAFTKQATQAEAAGQAIQRQAQQVTSAQQRLAEAANTILRTSVGQGGVTAGNLESLRGQIQKQLGVAPTLSATDLGLQAQAARADQVARARTVAVQDHSARPASSPADVYRQPSPESMLWGLRQPIAPPRQPKNGNGSDEDGGGAMGFLNRGQGAVRFAAGILGIGLGLNVASSAATKLHEELAKSIEAERGIEIGARSIAAAFGASVLPSFQAASKAFVLDPSTRGTQAQFSQAAVGMRELTAAYGLNDQQVQMLLRDAGQLARIHGTDLPTAAKALQSVMMGNTSAAASFGVALTDEMGRLRGVGASYEELVAISGRSRAEAVLLAKTHEAVAAQQTDAAKTSDELAAALDRLTKAEERSRAALGDSLKGAATLGTNVATNVMEGKPLSRQIEDWGFKIGTDLLEKAVGVAFGPDAQQRAHDQIAKAIGDIEPPETAAASATQAATAAAQTQLTTFERWRTEITRTTQALDRLQEVTTQFATIAKAAEGVDFPFRLAPGQAAAIGGARAAVDLQNEQAQKIAADRAQAMRAHLVYNVQTAEQGRYTDPDTKQVVEHSNFFGPDSDAAKRARIDLVYFDQRAAGQSKLVEAQHEQVNAELALSVARRQDLDNVQAIANAQAEITSHAQEQRDIAHELNSIDDQRVQVNRELAVLQARQNALPAGRAVQDLERERAILLAEAHLHPEQRGDVAGRVREIAIHGLPQAQSADLKAQGPVIATQRAQEDADIARQIRLSPTRSREIDLEALLQPVRDKVARLAEAQELVRLGATPEEVRAEMARRAAEDAQKALVTIPSPSAAATAAGVGAGGTSAGPQTFQITVYANGAVEGAGGRYSEAAQKGGVAFSAAFRESLATRGTPPVRPMLGGADNLLTP